MLNIHSVNIPLGTVALLSIFSGGSLREVNVSQCQHISDSDIEILAETCANSLTTFKAAGTQISDRSIRALGTRCSLLTVLDLSHCPFITDSGFSALCPSSGIYTQVKNEDNVFRDTSGGRRGCPALKQLNLEFSSGLTENAVLAIAGLRNDANHGLHESQVGGMKQLETLDVRGLKLLPQLLRSTLEKLVMA